MIRAMERRSYWHRVLDLLSQVGNTVFLNGEPDESISGRGYRRTQEDPDHWFWPRLKVAVDFLFFWEDTHTRNAYTLDILRAYTRVQLHRNRKELDYGHPNLPVERDLR